MFSRMEREGRHLLVISHSPGGLVELDVNTEWEILQETLSVINAHAITGVKILSINLARCMFQDRYRRILHDLFRDAHLQALREQAQAWYSGSPLVVKLKEPLQLFLELLYIFADFSRIAWLVLRREPQPVFSLPLRMLLGAK